MPARTHEHERLDENGFAIATSAVDEATVETLRAAFPRSEGGGRRRQGGIREALRLPSIRAFAASPAMKKLASSALSGKVFAVHGTLFDKTPRANWRVAWHQDEAISVRGRVEVAGFGPWSTKQDVLHVRAPTSVLDRVIALRVHLDDCGPGNGPLRVVPGSHRAGRLSVAEIERLRQTVKPVECHARAGDVLLMRPLLLHASSSATEPGHRRVLHLEYSDVELPGGLEWANVI